MSSTSSSMRSIGICLRCIFSRMLDTLFTRPLTCSIGEYRSFSRCSLIMCSNLTISSLTASSYGHCIMKNIPQLNLSVSAHMFNYYSIYFKKFVINKCIFLLFSPLPVRHSKGLHSVPLFPVDLCRFPDEDEPEIFRTFLLLRIRYLP